jgi:tetratricopeptide (TPR) repeat protein
VSSTGRGRGGAAALDPDELAALLEQRDFLLTSLDDLEREHSAGDLDDDDYTALRDDYTARAAEVLRAIDDRRQAMDEVRPPPSPGRVAAIAAAVLVVAALAGVGVAQVAGRRSAGETATGGVRPTATQEARRCQPLTAGGKAGQAVECYQAVLDENPDNPTALAWLGWTLVLSSGALEAGTQSEALAAGKSFLDRAVAADADYPDARAFRAIVAQREGRLVDAKADLDALYAADPPPQVRSLTDTLREEVERELAEPTAATTTATTAPGP